MRLGSVISSQAILALFLSPPDRPGTHIPPIAENKIESYYLTHLARYYYSIRSKHCLQKSYMSYVTSTCINKATMSLTCINKVTYVTITFINKSKYLSLTCINKATYVIITCMNKVTYLSLTCY